MHVYMLYRIARPLMWAYGFGSTATQGVPVPRSVYHKIIVAAGPEMAGKATEPFWTTPCPLSTLSWDLGAKSAAASEQTAS